MFAKFKNFILPVDKILYAEYSGKKPRIAALRGREPMECEYGTNVRLVMEGGMTRAVHLSDKDILDEFNAWLEKNRPPVMTWDFGNCWSDNWSAGGQAPKILLTEAVQDENGNWKTVTTQKEC